MKKKSLLFPALALVLSLCLALAACGSGGVNALTAESGVTAEGAFENGSVLNAAHHASDSEQGKAAIAAIDKPYDNAKVAVFDITLTKDGEKTQPNGKVKITMPKPFESDGYVTYHVKDDNTTEELATTAHGNNIYFETTSFSYFVVAGSWLTPINSIYTVTSKKSPTETSWTTQHAKERLCIALFAVFAAVWAEERSSTANLLLTTCARKRVTIRGAKKTDLPTANVA